MFKSKTKMKATTNSSLEAHQPLVLATNTCRIAEGTNLEGKFSSNEDLLVDGSIKGDVVCKGNLIMGPTGLIEGTIHTHSATINGCIKGTLIVQGILHLENTAKVEGIILAESLIVDEGAVYNGECKIGERFVREKREQVAVA